MKTLQLIALLSLPFSLLAQESGVATYSITYGYCALADPQATLHFNGDKSFFETTAGPNNTFFLVLHDTLNNSQKRLNSTMANQSQVYTNLKEGKIITSNSLFLSEVYFTLEKPNSISWEIHNDTKKIGTYICNKAIGSFRGREYTAWFTRDIPVEFGPWKFNGLPGLIIEVVEKGMHVHFVLQSINFPYKQEIEPIVAKNYLTVSEYLNRFKAEVLERTPDHPARHKPGMKTYIDINTFTELESPSE